MKPVINDRMINAAVESLRNEKLVLGESVYKFEEKFAKYVGTKYAVATNSGTMALFLALKSLGIKSNDEVITTPMSFIATSNAILHNEGLPLFVDIDDTTGNIDTSRISINEKSVKAILPVHLYGNVCDMGKIEEISESYDIPIIEDDCQAHGATYKGKKAGSLGDIGCFSFYSTKNMTVGGDGGIITTNNEATANYIRKLTDCGRINRYEHDAIGYTARLNTINSAIGLLQLEYLDEWNQKRKGCAHIYKINLPEEIQLNYEDGCVYYTYVMKSDKRDNIARNLEKNNIQTGVYYPTPIHLQPIYRKLFGYSERSFPIAEEYSKKILSLPMFPELEKDDIKFICEKVNEALER